MEELLLPFSMIDISPANYFQNKKVTNIISLNCTPTMTGRLRL